MLAVYQRFVKANSILPVGIGWQRLGDGQFDNQHVLWYNRLMKTIMLLTALVLCSCGDDTTMGIPNFKVVDASIYRGGQPCPNGWGYLKTLLIACYRLQQGWSVEEAEAEMLTNGFHKDLKGLWWFWNNLYI
jgi:hypothetical protein